jgi:hypothetical protein
MWSLSYGTARNGSKNEIALEHKAVKNIWIVVKNNLPSRLTSINVMTKITKTFILPSVVYGCETWFVTLRDEYRWGVCKKRVLRRIFGSEGKEETTDWEKHVMSSFISCTCH